jgi:hypothetical protein
MKIPAELLLVACVALGTLATADVAIADGRVPSRRIAAKARPFPGSRFIVGARPLVTRPGVRVGRWVHGGRSGHVLVDEASNEVGERFAKIVELTNGAVIGWEAGGDGFPLDVASGRRLIPSDYTQGFEEFKVVDGDLVGIRRQERDLWQPIDHLTGEVADARNPIWRFRDLNAFLRPPARMPSPTWLARLVLVER